MNALKALAMALIVVASLACAGKTGDRPKPKEKDCYATLLVRNDSRRVINLRSGIWKESRLARWIDSPGQKEICLQEMDLTNKYLIVWIEDRMLGPQWSESARWYLIDDAPYIAEGSYWELTIGYGVNFWGFYLQTGGW